MTPDPNEIYLDNLASTRIGVAALEAMTLQFRAGGNAASRTHAFGWRAEAVVAEARREVADLIGAARPRDVIFTSGATESNNTVVRGVAAQFPSVAHVITTAIEHPSILEACLHEQRSGRIALTVVPVDTAGVVSAAAITEAIRETTRLITVQMANNEVGSLQPIAEIAAVARSRGIAVHVDAAQAVAKVALDVQELDVDLVSLSAHKIHGPQGVGALYLRPGARPLPPLLLGGGQESGARSGTQPVALIAGFGAACREARGQWREEAVTVAALRDTLWDALNQQLDGLRCNGATGLPGCLNITIDGVTAAALMAEAPQLAFSSASACSSSHGSGSHVLTAMGLTASQQGQTVRFGLSRDNSPQDVARAAEILVAAVSRLRRIRLVDERGQVA